ncbi:MAG: 3TM-type holin [Planctomycetota bacterium]|jgi:hypothetical protein
MALPAWIMNLFDPAVKLVDELHTSAEEKGQMKAVLFTAQAGIVSNVLEYEAKIMGMQRDIVLAEAQGDSWLQKNWRPLLMISIVAIVVNNHLLFPYLRLFWTSAPVLELPADLWDLMKIGVGGYVLGRSGEKIVKTLNKN